MRGVMAITLAVFVGCFAGAARAGEAGVMAMRGNPPDGVRPYNVIGGISQGGVGEGEAGTHAPAAMAAFRVEEPRGLVRGRPEQFIRWRNNCIRTPCIMGELGATLTVPAGFGFTPRFVERLEGGCGDFLATLWKTLTSD